jgi:hypothetical protein
MMPSKRALEERHSGEQTADTEHKEEEQKSFLLVVDDCGN